MTATGVLIAIAFFALVFKCIGRAEGRATLPYQEGIMIKAIKITMGICIGLFLMYLLFVAGVLGNRSVNSSV